MNALADAHTINTQAVNAIFLYQIVDPYAVSRGNGWVLSVEVWKRDIRVAKPTGLNACQITPINRAIGMVLGLKRDIVRRIKLKLENKALPIP